jgi:hypothetical protein
MGGSSAPVGVASGGRQARNMAQVPWRSSLELRSNVATIVAQPLPNALVLVLLRYVKVDGFVCELHCHNTRTLRSR